MKQTVTVPEICEALNLPETSARRLLKRFRRYLPLVSETRPTRYRAETVEIMRLILHGQEQGLAPEEIEFSLRGAGVAMEAPGTTNLHPPQDQLQYIEHAGKILSLAGEIALRLQTKRQGEEDQNGRRILAALERQNAALERQNTLLERQNELLEKLAGTGVALPGESPSNSLQEAPGWPKGGGAVEPEGAAPENASEGRSRRSWWERLWRHQ
jgi:DNA-binding transcriptional MerR regulator